MIPTIFSMARIWFASSICIPTSCLRAASVDRSVGACSPSVAAIRSGVVAQEPRQTTAPSSLTMQIAVLSCDTSSPAEVAIGALLSLAR